MKKLENTAQTAVRGKGRKTIVSDLLLDIQVMSEDLITGHPVSPEVGQLVKKIADRAWYAQAVNTGLRTNDGEFNQHLLRLLGEVN